MEQKQLPETVKANLFIHVNHHDGAALAATCDMSQYGYTLLGTHEVEVPVPQVNVVEKEVESLNRQATALRAETHIKLKAIEDRINSLLAIEHKPEPGHEQ